MGIHGSFMLLLLALLSAVSAIAINWHDNKPRLYYLLKPLTTVLLGLYLLQAAPSTYRNWLLLGFVCSLAGDIALMFAGELAFMLGLGSFLIAHLLFSYGMVQEIALWRFPLWFVLPVVYTVLFFGWLLPKTGTLKIPVFIYGCMLLGMAFCAAVLALSENSAHGSASGGFHALIGALLFVLSDSALAVRRFWRSYWGAEALIHSTYWGSLFFIAHSAFRV